MAKILNSILRFRFRVALTSLLYLGITGLSMIGPYFLSRLVDSLTRSDATGQEGLRLAVLFILGSGLLLVVLSYIQTIILGQLSIELNRELRLLVVHQYLQSASANQTGEFITTTLRDVSTVVGFVLNDLNSVLTSFCGFIGVSIVLLRMNIGLYLAILAYVPIYWFMYRGIASKRYLIARDIRKTYARLTEDLTEAGNHKRTISLHRFPEFAGNVLKNSISFLNAQEYRRVRFGAFSSGVSSVVSFSLSAIILVFGTRSVLNGALSLGMFLAFMTYSSRLLAPISALVGIALSWQETRIALDHINAFLDLQVDTNSYGDVDPLITGAKLNVRPFTDNELQFCYQISLPGVVSILGPTGSGKSTLCGLLAGYLPPAEGTVSYVVGNRCHEAPLIRHRIVLLNGGMQLFSSWTIEDNLTLGVSGLTDKIAVLFEVMEMDILLRERGIGLSRIVDELNLSHGEIQRLLLVRALLLEPSILILDEALSGIEARLSHKIMGFVKNAVPSIIVVSHRDIEHTYSDCSIELSSRQIRAFNSTLREETVVG